MKGIRPMVVETSLPHYYLRISSYPEVKSNFLPNHWTKSYKPGVYREALDDA
jgi:hypothetical protein